VSAPHRTADVVFGRGGVRGIALAGAVAAFEERGYRFGRVVGVSAGALVAALVSAGYRAGEIRDVVRDLDYAGLRDARGIGRIPVVGPLLALVTRMGMCDGSALLDTFRALLAAKGVTTFGDLRDGRRAEPSPLRVLAADVTLGRMIVFPDDAPLYGVDPDRLEVALTLRMSASVPFFFRPVRFGSTGDGSLVLDGGLFLGLPFDLLDGADGRDRPVYGVLARTGREHHVPPGGIRGPISLLRASYRTAVAANARDCLGPADRGRTIAIECGDIHAVHFGLTDVQKAQLYDAGRTATHAFLAARSIAAARASA
jgi:NTE family protein